MPDTPIDTNQIVVTASRAPEKPRRTPGQRHDHRRASASSGSASRWSRALLRLVPSAAVATSRAGGLADRSPHPRRRGQPHLAVHRRHSRQRSRRRQRRRGSSCSMPTSPRGSRSCAARNRRCGDRKRSAAWSRSTGIAGVDGYAGVRRRRLVRLSPRRAASACATPTAASIAGAVGGSARPGSTASAGDGDKDGYRNLSGRLRGSWPARAQHRARRRRASRSPGEASSTASIPSPSSMPTRSTAAATGWPPAGSGRRPASRTIALERPASAHRCSARRTAIISTTTQLNRTAGKRRIARRARSSTVSSPARSTIA